jgi:hypothetical protein
MKNLILVLMLFTTNTFAQSTILHSSGQVIQTGSRGYIAGTLARAAPAYLAGPMVGIIATVIFAAGYAGYSVYSKEKQQMTSIRKKLDKVCPQGWQGIWDDRNTKIIGVECVKADKP